MALLDLADERFVSLTTFRKSGEAVSTPVWIARDGDALVVTTPVGSGKVKRLRNDARVVLRPCSRMGKVADDAPEESGVAVIEDDDRQIARITGVISDKYGVEYSLIMGTEKLVKRESRERVILRITAP
jgi:PPOX class probable F420-dependent enzyme